MSNNLKSKEVLIVGAGFMAKEHAKVLKALNVPFVVVGRGKQSAQDFEHEIGVKVWRDDLELVYNSMDSAPDHAIVAVGVEALANITLTLISLGVKSILVEKPAGINVHEIESIYQAANESNVNVYVAYNRRFYSSVKKAIELIKLDGGVTSFNFEFTEWAHTIEPLNKPMEVKKAWLMANSTHVIDLAFFLGGRPKQISTYVQGGLEWHPSGSRYCGAGITEKGVLFNYSANWEAPGRWGVEILTKRHRLYFRPMEQLAIQEYGTVKVEQIELDDILDKKFKPGVYEMLNVFLNDEVDNRLVSIQEHCENAVFYDMIANGNIIGNSI